MAIFAKHLDHCSARQEPPVKKTFGRKRFDKFRLFILALVLALPLPGTALFAQGEPPGFAGDQPPIDPPARVGRVSYIWGPVSFHGFDADHWDRAQLNYPVTSGESFWTQPDARTRLETGHAALTLRGATEVDVSLLDDENFQAVVAQGAINFRLRRLRQGQSYQFTTPGGTVAITAPGRYHIDAGDTTRASTIAVFEGAAVVLSRNGEFPVGAGEITTTDGQAWTGAAEPEELDAWSDRAEIPMAPIATYVSPDMPGAADLASTGVWQPNPDYGEVWYPPVDRDWAPYRYGHWAYVAPWGWTWIDDASWGFAPFHYGRWAMIDSRWGWVPGPETAAPPVYSPALVAFVGGGIAVGAAVSVGWIPLGPHEAYVPPYRTSPTYVQNVNIAEVNVTNRTVNRPVASYANAQATTVVPGAAMTSSRPIAAARVALPAAAFAHATVAAAAPVKPSLATVGASPALVRAVGGSMAGAPPHGASPGPAVQRQPIPASFVRGVGGHPAPGAPATPAAAAVAAHARPLTTAPAPSSSAAPPPRAALPSRAHAPPPPAHPVQPAAAVTQPHVPAPPTHPVPPSVTSPPRAAEPPSPHPVQPATGSPGQAPPSSARPIQPATTSPAPQPAAPPHPVKPAANPPHPAAPGDHQDKKPAKPGEKCDPKVQTCPG
jgi:hypothetical protein